jgi:hypothetical protein
LISGAGGAETAGFSAAVCIIMRELKPNGAE